MASRQNFIFSFSMLYGMVFAGHEVYTDPDGIALSSGKVGAFWAIIIVIVAILELNAHWIAGRSKAPVGADWEDFGRGLLPVFTDYFSPGRNP